ncbi:MAG: hypothetical protein ACP5I3_02635 [Thermoproteus sp.]|jgi:hypothetical protein
MDCASICGVSFSADFGEDEASLLRAIYAAAIRLGPPGACYVICKSVERLCGISGDCNAALREFVKKYPKAAELYRSELLRIAAGVREKPA